MNKQDIITMLENAGPFTNPMATQNTPTFGKCSMFEPARKFILAALKDEVKPAFQYPDHTGYCFKGCHLEIDRVCAEFGITDFVRASTGIYETIISFRF